jgi:NAD(P)-dependent dehydrogenase (short-subunit alcohol dehydrogenase family)
MPHPALQAGRVAVVTGSSSGIGLSAAKRFAALGMKVCMADINAERLESAATEVIAAAPDGAASVLAVATDVADVESVIRLMGAVRSRFHHVDVLMNNAGIQPGSGMFGPPDAWHRVIEVNLWGVINGTHVFVPGMITHNAPGLVINTGSKQGITTPPGDPAYNVSKAGVKVFTEALQHELRNVPGCKVTAHLLIPGFVYTPLTAKNRTEKPPGAWTPDQTVDYMMQSLERGDFYILCPDNDVPRQLDEQRIAWAAADIIENRPPLSRWHPDYAERFKDFLRRHMPG